MAGRDTPTGTPAQVRRRPVHLHFHGGSAEDVAADNAGSAMRAHLAVFRGLGVADHLAEEWARQPTEDTLGASRVHRVHLGVPTVSTVCPTSLRDAVPDAV